MMLLMTVQYTTSPSLYRVNNEKQFEGEMFLPVAFLLACQWPAIFLLHPYLFSTCLEHHEC